MYCVLDKLYNHFVCFTLFVLLMGMFIICIPSPAARPRPPDLALPVPDVPRRGGPHDSDGSSPAVSGTRLYSAVCHVCIFLPSVLVTLRLPARNAPYARLHAGP